MKKRYLILMTTTMIMTSLTAFARDMSIGTILAFDRKANTLVLTDRTVWPLDLLKTSLPAKLQAGDRVEIEYESDEDGISSIQSIEVQVDKMSKDGPQDVTQGTILAFDRKAKTLVLTDRTVWALQDIKSPLPDGLQEGKRIEIKYEADEDGVSSIQSITILTK